MTLAIHTYRTSGPAPAPPPGHRAYSGPPPRHCASNSAVVEATIAERHRRALYAESDQPDFPLRHRNLFEGPSQ